MMVAFASVNAMANTYPKLNVEGKRSFILELNDWKNEELFITIANADGETIHSENVNKRGNARKYSLEKLPVGFYRMTIADQMKDIAFDIFVTYEGVNIKNTGKIYFRPFVKNDGKYLDINLLTINKQVNVNLFDAEGNLIYTEKTDKIRKYEKRLDISKLAFGTYTLNMEIEGRSYSETVVR